MAEAKMKTALVLLALQLISVSLAYDSSQLATMRELVRGLLMEDCDRIGGFVRLGFHSCVGDACDGCIDLDNPDNTGFRVYIDPLEEVYQASVKSMGVSRADFWAVAATETAYFSVCANVCENPAPGGSGPPNGELCDAAVNLREHLHFRSGRQDCSAVQQNVEDGHLKDSPNVFPSPVMGNAAVLDYFQQTFGFDAQCTAAIMGAHSLGKAHEQFSNFDGPWLRNEFKLDNAFYVDLERFHWRQVANSDNKFYWRRTADVPGAPLMFNSDMMVSLDMDGADPSTGEITGPCGADSTSCDASAQTSAFTTNYVNDNNAFVADFGRCFDAMLSWGYPNGYLTVVEP